MTPTSPRTGPEALNFPAPPDGSWAATNLAEALPGVATPLSWSVWARAADLGARAPFEAMGAIPPGALAYPERSEDRLVNLFYGRVAIRVDYFCEVGDLVPGASGEAIARDAFGFVPESYVPQRSRRRWPVFFAKMPAAFLRTPGQARAALERAENSHPVQVARTPTLDLPGAREQLLDAKRIFEHNMSVQARAIGCVIQPVFTALTQLAADAGVEAGPLMRGHGAHEEGELLSELWRLSRGDLELDLFLRRFGFHGPDEGELSSRSWREDPAPLLRMIKTYQDRPEAESPLATVAAGAALREQAEAELLRALPASKRPGGKLVLKLARQNLPLRSVAKIAYLHSFDVARAAARRIGSLLAQDGAIDDPEDVFYLTVEEVLGHADYPLRAVVEERRAQRREYEEMELDVHFTGRPTPRPIEVAGARAARPAELVGLGVSPGVVEGRALVVHDPSETDMDGGEVLVARTTDPAWASVMFLASALVVDIGGMISHAAVVARELGVPCVMDTKDGTRRLRTGDLVRVDGGKGTVEILERAEDVEEGADRSG